MSLRYEIIEKQGQRERELIGLAYENDKQKGSVRVISEGVETALLVDLTAEGEDAEIKRGLLAEIEKKFPGRRVMVYGNLTNLPVLEAAGYSRCKNAWTYFREGFPEGDFLPPAYRYESDFTVAAADKKAQQETNKTVHGAAEIVYRTGHLEGSYEQVAALLSKAFPNRPLDPARTEKAFLGSSYNIFAFDGDRIVGTARAAADGKRYATILNVAVDPEYQGLSIGKNVVVKLAESVSEEIVVLDSHAGVINFYNRLKEFRRNKYVFEKFIPDPSSERRFGGGNADFRTQMFTPAGYRFPDEY